MGVNPCGRCAIVTLLPQIAKLPKKSIKHWFQDKWAYLRSYIAPLLNEANILSFGDELSGGSKKNYSSNLISELLSLKTTIDIPIIISHIKNFNI